MFILTNKNVFLTQIQKNKKQKKTFFSEKKQSPAVFNKRMIRPASERIPAVAGSVFFKTY